MKSKGIYFGADFSFAFVLFFICIFLILAQLNQTISNIAIKQKELELESNGIFLIDSLIKNRDQNFPLLGSAYYNSKLKRVEQNVLDLGLLRQINAKHELDGIFLKSIYLEYKDKEKEKIFERQTEKNCIGFERFVLIKDALLEKKGKIVAEVCDEK